MSLITKSASKRKVYTKEDLEVLEKEELVNRILQLEAHNIQLKNTLQKHLAKSEDLSFKNERKRPFDFSKHTRRHVLLKFLYLGWDYQGYVTQENTNKTIEFLIFSALLKACLIENRESCNYHRCGRTDKGVSSFCQTISLDVRSKLPEAEIAKGSTEGEINYVKILNRLLPEDIKMLAWKPVSDNFSARFDCMSRTYKYFFPRGDLNIDLMNEAAQYLVGTHDFRNFCKLDIKNGVVNYTRDVQFVLVSLRSTDPFGNKGYDLCEFTIKGKAFLWHQIRCIMGVIILVGQGREQPEIVRSLLDINENPCKPQYNIAADLPLNLFHCEYEDVDHEFQDSEDLENVVRSLQRSWGQYAIRADMIRCMLNTLEEPLVNAKLLNQAAWLLQGVHPQEYKALLSRSTCESLENRIEHYRKKRKLNENEFQNINKSVCKD